MTTMGRWGSWIVILLLSQTGFATELLLSEVIKNNLSGIQSDPSFTDKDSKIRKQAQSFIDFRWSRMSSKDKLSWVENCYKEIADNVFCDFIPEKKKPKQAKTKAPIDYDIPLKVAEAISAGEFKLLNESTDSQINRALRLFPDLNALEKVAQSILGSSSCIQGPLTGVLATKMEEFFPDNRAQKLARELYEKTQDCGEDELSTKARYRLSLLLIWDGQCRKAEPLLMKLTDVGGSDYGPRALYWRAYCAQKVGNKLLAQALKGRLHKEYPLSFHGLVLGSERDARMSWILTGDQPKILLRSDKKPDFNRYVQAAESMQALKASDLSLEFLDSIEDRLDETEIGFRLYVAVLAGRAGDPIFQFKLLSSIFRDQPSLISRATLELFYPLKKFDILKTHEPLVDPLLVAALIRQESGFNEKAMSRVGARGLMQLMPATARLLERVSKNALFDPKVNIRLGVRYYSHLLRRYSADAELALAAYNAGPERVDEWRRRYPTSNRLLFFDLIPFKETRDYVALIGRNYYWYQSLYGEDYGRQLASNKRPLIFTLQETQANEKDSEPAQKN